MPEGSPLESFLLEYVDTVGGAWQAVEPQVYDVMLPPDAAGRLDLPQPGEMIRIAFDPEAVAEHPAAHLMAFGNPVLDRAFEHAQELGRSGRVYVSGFNLSPHDLPSALRRGLQVTAGVQLRPAAPRVYHFGQALFWFQVTFVSDEKEQSIVRVGIDLYYGRVARHLEDVLRGAVVTETRPLPYPDAPHIAPAQAYHLAREEVTRSVAVAAAARLNELQHYLERETQRMSRYFDDLRAELAERQARAETKGEDAVRFESQRQALDYEEQARLTELRRKMTLRVQMKLLNVLWVIQSKLLIRTQFVPQQGLAGEIDVVWDPALQKVEAARCPACGRPTLALALTRFGRVVCPACVDTRKK